MRRIFPSSVFILLLLVGCKEKTPTTISETEIASLSKLGDSIATEVQNTLLKNVSNAIEKGGTDYAVEYCNLKALPLTDSISQKHQVKIQRLSNKNRNPNNAIETAIDQTAWKHIQSQKSSTILQDHQGKVYYYKPIVAAMPTCIKCHGTTEDISENTQKIIAQQYPNDKATGYKTGDLRGMWKIEWK